MNGYITVKRIADDISDHPLLRDIPYDRIVNYIFELIRIVGCPKLYIEKVGTVEVKNHRGELPCDFISMIQVRGNCGEEYVSTTDNFVESNNKLYETGISTYKIQGRVIITSKEDTTVEIAYQALPFDEHGFPLFPDCPEFIRAVEAYIKLQRFTILFDLGQINQAVYQNAQQDYSWKVGQAQNALKIPTIDEMETITHIWNNLIPHMTEHQNGFATMHNREYLKRH